MRKYPKNLVVKFRPTAEVRHFRACGISLKEPTTISLPREDALYCLHYFNSNFAPDFTFPPTDTIVSAVLPTCKGRELMATNCVNQFLSQTYPYKELIIINQGNKWIVQEDVEGITEVMAHKTLTNGAMRNIGDSIAIGQYIIRFDDDDIFSNNRIEEQLNAIKETGYPASSYNSYVIYIREDNIIFEYDAGVPCVGLMMYENKGLRYEEDLIIGSDSIFATNFNGLIVEVDNKPSDYVRIYNGNNLHSKNKLLGMYAGNKKDLAPDSNLLTAKSDKEKVVLAIKKIKNNYMAE